LSICSNGKDNFISGSKDKNIRVWDTNQKRCIAIGDSHSGSVTVVKYSPKRKFLVSGSEDKTLKLWKLDQLEKKLKSNEVITLQCFQTVIAHKKEISDISISPDESLIASCSSDRTVKLWKASDLSLIKEFKHKNGVWSIDFSPVDKVLITACSDFKIRIWSLSTGAVLNIYEGHDQSVLKVSYINKGLQVILY
jgi:U3 small nucleolar RNA-associated protein 13